MNIQSCMELQTTLVRRKKRVVKAGGPGSGNFTNHPSRGGMGVKDTDDHLWAKYLQFLDQQHSLSHVEHAKRFFRTTSKVGKEALHDFFNTLLYRQNKEWPSFGGIHWHPDSSLGRFNKWTTHNIADRYRFQDFEAGGPGSGPRPGGGSLAEKYASFAVRHNPDMGNGRGVENYEHAANFLHNLSEGAKTTMHQFFDHMDKASGLGKNYSRVDHRGNLRMK